MSSVLERYKQEAASAEEVKRKILDFRGVGETFYYCDILMCVEEITFPPALVASYKNNDGELRREIFQAGQIDAIIRQNKD